MDLRAVRRRGRARCRRACDARRPRRGPRDPAHGKLPGAPGRVVCVPARGRRLREHQCRQRRPRTGILCPDDRCRGRTDPTPVRPAADHALPGPELGDCDRRRIRCAACRAPALPPGGPGRARNDHVHVGNHLAPEGCAVDARQCDVGRADGRDAAGPATGRRVPGLPAALPCGGPVVVGAFCILGRLHDSAATQVFRIALLAGCAGARLDRHLPRAVHDQRHGAAPCAGGASLSPVGRVHMDARAGSLLPRPDARLVGHDRGHYARNCRRPVCTTAAAHHRTPVHRAAGEGCR